MSRDNDGGKDEEERRDRQMLELLNELRVALPGVQVLFAFLLTVPFNQRFADVTDFQRDVYFVTLLATTVSAVFLIAPSAAHRVRFHQRDRAWLIESTNVLMLIGLAFLAVAMTGAVLLVTDFLFEGPMVIVYPALAGVLTVGVWFIRPLLRYLSGESSGP
jgi:hypothetical protein